MTVATLIELLSKMPKDANVLSISGDPDAPYDVSEPELIQRDDGSTWADYADDPWVLI